MKCRYLILLLCLAIEIQAKNTIYSPQIKTLQSVVNKDWLAPTVMRLNSDDILNIEFDDLSDNINQYIYKIDSFYAFGHSFEHAKIQLFF